MRKPKRFRPKQRMRIVDTDDICPTTGKVGYPTGEAVRLANPSTNGSSYRCPHCGAYHFTTKVQSKSGLPHLKCDDESSEFTPLQLDAILKRMKP